MNPLESTNFIARITRKKLIVGVIALVLLVELVAAYWYLSKSNKVIPVLPGASVKKVVVNQATSLGLVSDKTALKVGDKFIVSIIVDSSKATDGVDVILRYDPKTLRVISNSLKVPITTGTIYNNYPLNRVDEKSGNVYLSGIASATPVVPKGVLGTIQFQTKTAGSTSVSFGFTKGATNDSNVTETKTAKDVLELVNNLSLNVQP